MRCETRPVATVRRVAQKLRWPGRWMIKNCYPITDYHRPAEKSRHCSASPRLTHPGQLWAGTGL